MALFCRGSLLALPVLLLSLLPARALRSSPGSSGSLLVSDTPGGGSGGDEDGTRLFFQPDGTFRILQLTDLQ